MTAQKLVMDLRIDLMMCPPMDDDRRNLIIALSTEVGVPYGKRCSFATLQRRD
jgi:hypothetical protein